MKRFERKWPKGEYARLDFLEKSYEGGEEYVDEMLIRHPRESEENFLRRKRTSVYVNYCAPIADLYTQYLFRENIVRNLEGIDEQTATAYMDDADMNGRTHEQVVRIVARMAGVTGISGVLIDKPAQQATSRADAIAKDLRPYAVMYETEAIYDWHFSRIGGRKVLDYLVLEDDEDVFKIWTLDLIETFEQKDGENPTLIDSQPNPLGMIPFIIHRNRDTIDAEMMEGLSDIDGIADVARKVFEIDAQIAEIINNTAFPMLAGPADTSTQTNSDGDVVIGTGSFLEERQGEPGYRYVEPAHSSLNNLWTIRQGYVDELYKLARSQSANATSSRAVQKSGVALEIEFQDLNAILSEKAEQCEKLENKMLEYVAKWEGETFTGYVEYPRRFGIRDLASDLDTAIKAKTLISSPTFSKAISVDFAGRVLRDPEQETLDAIDAELTAKPIEIPATIPGVE